VQECAAGVARKIVRPFGPFHFDLYHTGKISFVSQVFRPSLARNDLSRRVTCNETSSDERQCKENNVEHGHGSEVQQLIGYGGLSLAQIKGPVLINNTWPKKGASTQQT
jgi:hypothetical protein